MSTSSSLLRTNRNFRLLFFGQAVSQLGDWFNSVAVFALLLDLTGSATAVAWLMIVQFLPMAVVGPVAGVVVDRVDRRRLMIAADLVRSVLVLGLLLVRTAGDVWIAYAVMTLTVTASAFFEPARTATIPNVTSQDELLPASALSSATWAAMLAVGASVGGLVTAFAGREFAFVLNALSFVASAAFISRTQIGSTSAHTAVPSAAGASPPAAAADAGRRARRGGWRTLLGLADLSEGLGYLRRDARVAALIFVKAGWGLAGGVLLLLSVFGQRVFPVAGSTAAGIGVLYGARGIGAGLAPFALRFILGQSPTMMRRAIGPAYFVVGGFYVALAAAGSLPVAAACVLLAHFGGSILWVFSTVLLQMEVPDVYRGRVFAAELALVTITSSLSSYATAFALDVGGWSPRALSSIIGTAFAVPGGLWLLWNWRLSAPDAGPSGTSAPDGADAGPPGQVSRA